MSEDEFADEILKRAAEDVQAIVARRDAERAAKPAPTKEELRASQEGWARWQVRHDEVMRRLADAKWVRACA